MADLPPTLEGLLRACLALRPAARPTAASTALALERVAGLDRPVRAA